jgi:hypothetical protein
MNTININNITLDMWVVLIRFGVVDRFDLQNYRRLRAYWVKKLITI